MLEVYLCVSNNPRGLPKVTVLHYIVCYSAGFGGSMVHHGRILGLLGEMIGDKLPLLVHFMAYKYHDLGHALLLEEVMLAPAAHIEAYFNGPVPHLLVVEPMVAANGGVATNFSCLCPIPIMWASYFMDFKSPWAACKTGIALMATPTNANECMTVDSMLLD